MLELRNLLASESFKIFLPQLVREWKTIGGGLRAILHAQFAEGSDCLPWRFQNRKCERHGAIRDWKQSAWNAAVFLLAFLALQHRRHQNLLKAPSLNVAFAAKHFPRRNFRGSSVPKSITERLVSVNRVCSDPRMQSRRHGMRKLRCAKEKRLKKSVSVVVLRESWHLIVKRQQHRLKQ